VQPVVLAQVLVEFVTNVVVTVWKMQPGQFSPRYVELKNVIDPGPVKVMLMSNPLICPASVTLTSILNELAAPIAGSTTAEDFLASLNNARSAWLLGGLAWASGTIGGIDGTYPAIPIVRMVPKNMSVIMNTEFTGLNFIQLPS
jgi:hypothetical protein